jgi:hypothetical protein
VGEPEPFQQKDEGYHINDFLKYHDQQFVINAYWGILRRGSDSEGLTYFLKNLRSGKMTKAEVLGRLRYAPEGRAAKGKVSGLFWNFVQSLYGVACPEMPLDGCHQLSRDEAPQFSKCLNTIFHTQGVPSG